jgi:hypothetical protein
MLSTCPLITLHFVALIRRRNSGKDAKLFLDKCSVDWAVPRLGFFSAVFLGYTAQQILLTRAQKGAYKRPQATSLQILVLLYLEGHRRRSNGEPVARRVVFQSVEVFD